MNDAVERSAKWLVGDRLACVLHVGDGALAYRLVEQGHEVIVAGTDVVRRRHPEIAYVRTGGERLPFAARAFDAVVVPELRESPSALAEYARVLRPGGLVSTMTRRHDESVPWVRKLRQIVGVRGGTSPAAATDTFGASGLFAAPETHEFAVWEELDSGGFVQFARDTGRYTDDATLARVHQLFLDSASGAGFLRLRHETLCVRARVDKSALTEDPAPPDTLLIDLS
ncbi:MAG: class I SAM-dependent methyltransferase [Aeromicrobium sp.]|uniref:class I SAM-dependent methyltransferase n=1 Tax=Aeromicrobium sp. TaxID=1871063 RepID=UPI0039E35CA2